jgi:eukaryotic-like serine/threonine-protein kinase
MFQVGVWILSSVSPDAFGDEFADLTYVLGVETARSPGLEGPRSLQPADSERLEPLRDGEIERFSGERWDEQEAVRAAAARELHADVLEPAVERLAGIALVSGLALAAYLAIFFAFLPTEAASGPSFRRLAPLLGGSILLSFATYGVTKIKKLRPNVVRDLGYVYLILLSLLLGLAHHAQDWQGAAFPTVVSPVVVPILAFGALIAATPRISLAICVAAASMDPLAMYFMRHHAGASSTGDTLLKLTSPYIAALIAYQISRVVHRLNEGIVKAREVGSYQLVQQIGVGGMAEVWRAEHRMLARPAAVKLIQSKVLIDHGAQEAARLLRLFLREARTTASLSSPHTIQLYDFGVTREGAFYYVMELLHGVDLKRLVERFGAQPPERVAHLLKQVCHSLHEAHERHFVHRDVKPANVFTCMQGGDYDFVKVVDFGLVLDRHPTQEEIEDEKRFVGTPAIMAPEMIRFQAPVDPRADLYAVGCVGYWLLTGKRVFDAATRHDMLIMHAHQKPIPPSKRVGHELHRELEAVIMACLEKNPARRPQTARELRERLSALSFETPWSDERGELWWKRYRPSMPAPSDVPAEPSLAGHEIVADEPRAPDKAVT